MMFPPVRPSSATTGVPPPLPLAPRPSIRTEVVDTVVLGTVTLLASLAHALLSRSVTPAVGDDDDALLDLLVQGQEADLQHHWDTPTIQTLLHHVRAAAAAGGRSGRRRRRSPSTDDSIRTPRPPPTKQKRSRSRGTKRQSAQDVRCTPARWPRLRTRLERIVQKIQFWAEFA